MGEPSLESSRLHPYKEIQLFEQYKKLAPVQSSLQNGNKFIAFHFPALLLTFSPCAQDFTGISFREDSVSTYFY